MMDYERAVQVWGAMRLAERYQVDVDLIDVDSVSADIEMDQGYHSDDSFAESAHVYVSVRGRLVWASYVMVPRRDSLGFEDPSRLMRVRYSRRDVLEVSALDGLGYMSLSELIAEVLAAGDAA